MASPTVVETGVYRIRAFYYPVVIDLEGANSDDKTKIIGWQDTRAYNQAWFIQEVQGVANTYTIRNVAAGSYMDLSGGSSADGTQVIGYHKNDSLNQQWAIIRTDGYYKFQNRQSQTFLDLNNGSTDNGTKIQGWKGDWNSSGGGHQAWDLTPISLSSEKVSKLLKEHPYLKKDLPSYVSDSPYLALTHDIFQQIWDSTGLRDASHRREIYDSDDFALKFKTAVAAWGNKNFKVDGLAILCGMMYGLNDKGTSNAFNFYLVEGGLGNLIFFDPQTGQNNFIPWEYKPYFGLF